MSPNVMPGDLVWIRFRAPHLGEVVRVRMDADEAPQLARVVAKAGETLEVSEGVLYVDGMPAAVGARRRAQGCKGEALHQVAETWRTKRVWVVPGATVAPVQIPLGEVYVMGDHRLIAGDSQRWGTVALERVEGVATTLLWPSQRCGRNRWSQLGKRID
jgi:signal peptidase I